MGFANSDSIERALSLLSATLEAREAAPVGLVVIGGAAMNVLGIRIRPTKDVDVVAVQEGSLTGEFVMVKHKSLPPTLAAAALAVAEALDLEPDWLNVGPADLLDWGLPDGFERRLTARRYGTHLTVHLPSREDLVCLKVFAAADAGVGRHTEDLEALQPTCDELVAGALWSATHDPSDDVRTLLAGLLRHFGCSDAAKEMTGEA